MKRLMYISFMIVAIIGTAYSTPVFSEDDLLALYRQGLRIIEGYTPPSAPQKFESKGELLMFLKRLLEYHDLQDYQDLMSRPRYDHCYLSAVSDILLVFCNLY